jgi:hypothetical protein
MERHDGDRTYRRHDAPGRPGGVGAVSSTSYRPTSCRCCQRGCFGESGLCFSFLGLRPVSAFTGFGSPVVVVASGSFLSLEISGAVVDEMLRVRFARWVPGDTTEAVLSAGGSLAGAVIMTVDGNGWLSELPMFVTAVFTAEATIPPSDGDTGNDRRAKTRAHIDSQSDGVRRPHP